MAAGVNGTIDRRHRSDRLQRTAGDYTTYMGTSGNGWPTVGTSITAGHRRTAGHGCMGIAVSASGVAVPGIAVPSSFAPLSAARTASATEATASASALPEVWIKPCLVISSSQRARRLRPPVECFGWAPCLNLSVHSLTVQGKMTCCLHLRQPAPCSSVNRG